jgi:hypothetical protein
MTNYLKQINAFLNETSEVKNVEILLLALCGIIVGLQIAELANVIRARRLRKAKEATR